MRSEAAKPILVAGIGNLLLRDDGVGVHAVRALSEDPPPGALVVDVGVGILDALHLLEEADRVVVIDAMRAGGPPGTIYDCGIDDTAEDPCQVSLHELGVRSALRMLGSGRTPAVRVVGVEPQEIDYGMELTAPVAAAVPDVIALVRRIVAEWRG